MSKDVIPNMSKVNKNILDLKFFNVYFFILRKSAYPQAGEGAKKEEERES